MKFHSKTILILIILCDIVALVSYYFLFQHIEVQTKTASSLINTIDLGTQKNSQLSSLRTIVRETEGKRQQLVTFLLPNDSEISFIGQIESLAKSSGLDVKTNSVSSLAGDTSATKTFEMQVGTTGNWSNTMYFLDQIENLPYNILISNFSVSEQGKTWTATFDIGVTENAQS